jgi:AcrR family transcriptional regulator
MKQPETGPSDRSEDALSRSGVTRERLILAAEELFARDGIDAVSLRQVNAAAGQRNASAAHYHFGSKDALIEAVSSYRLARVNGRRLERLAALEARVEPPSLRELVEAMIFPMVEEIETAPGGPHYIQMLAQLGSHPSHDLGKLVRSRNAEALQRCARLAAVQLPDVPARIFEVRFGLMILTAISALANRERMLVSPATDEVVGMPMLMSVLVDSLVASLAAPVSAATLQELQHNTRRRA